MRERHLGPGAQRNVRQDGTRADDELGHHGSREEVIQALGTQTEVRLEFLLPDKYRHTEHMSVAGTTRTVSMGLNGATFFYDDGGAAAASGLNLEGTGPMRADAIEGLREEVFSGQTLVLLDPSSSSSAHLTAPSANGVDEPEEQADAVDVKEPSGLNIRLFFDRTSHWLVLATYQVERIDPGQANALTQALIQQVRAGQLDPKNAGQVVRDEMARLQKKLLSVRMHLSEPKMIGGVTFPTKILTEGARQGPEEWTLSAIAVNTPIKAEAFGKQH